VTNSTIQIVAFKLVTRDKWLSNSKCHSATHSYDHGPVDNPQVWIRPPLQCLGDSRFPDPARCLSLSLSLSMVSFLPVTPVLQRLTLSASMDSAVTSCTCDSPTCVSTRGEQP
jgi:hypothetical protein